MFRNVENIMIIKKCWWDVGLRRLQQRLDVIAKMIVSRLSSFSSFKHNTWNRYNLHTSHSWALYLTLPQLSARRASTMLGNSQETAIGNSWAPQEGPCLCEVLLGVMHSACSVTQCGGLSFVLWLKVTCWWVTGRQRTIEEQVGCWAPWGETKASLVWRDVTLERDETSSSYEIAKIVKKGLLQECCWVF